MCESHIHTARTSKEVTVNSTVTLKCSEVKGRGRLKSKDVIIPYAVTHQRELGQERVIGNTPNSPQGGGGGGGLVISAYLSSRGGGERRRASTPSRLGGGGGGGALVNSD